MTIDWLVEALQTIHDAIGYHATSYSEGVASAEHFLLAYIDNVDVTKAYYAILAADK